MKLDRRQIRTRNMLLEALLALIPEMGIEKITVSDLMKKADLNRSTFYLHYTDIFDLLEQTKQAFLTGVSSIIQRFNLQDLIEHASTETAYPVMKGFIKYLGENSRFFEIMLGPGGDPKLITDLKQLMMRYMKDKITLYQPFEKKMSVPRDFLIAYVASAYMGVIQHWIESGRKLSPEQLTLLIQKLIKQGALTSTGIKPKK